MPDELQLESNKASRHRAELESKATRHGAEKDTECLYGVELPNFGLTALAKSIQQSCTCLCMDGTVLEHGRHCTRTQTR